MGDVCSCGNAFDGDNLCMPSACQWEGIERPDPRGISGFASCCINIGKPECRCANSTPTEREAGDVGEVELTEDEIESLVYASGPDADYDPLVDAVERIIAERERAAGARALREAADLLDSDADRARAEDPNSTPNGRDYFQGQHIALRANAIRLRDRADALAPENAQEGR